MSLFGGKTGRFNIMLISLVMALVGLVLTAFCNGLVMASIGLFIASFGIQNAFNICFYFIAETTSETHREKYSVLVQLFFGFGVVSNVAYFYLFGDWKIIMFLFYVLPSLLTIAATYFYV